MKVVKIKQNTNFLMSLREDSNSDNSIKYEEIIKKWYVLREGQGE